MSTPAATFFRRLGASAVVATLPLAFIVAPATAATINHNQCRTVYTKVTTIRECMENPNWFERKFFAAKSRWVPVGFVELRR